MSVTTYYGRLSKHQYESMREHPDGLAQFVTGAIPQEQLLYLDKATPVIAWLLSPLKRFEQAHFAAVCSTDDTDTFEAPNLGSEPEMDEILIPLEGRDLTDAVLDVGMGPACVIQTEDVSKYAHMFENISELRLREQLNFQELEDAALPVDYWLEEGEQIFIEYVLPLFNQLKQFYRTAASGNEMILIWYS